MGWLALFRRLFGDPVALVTALLVGILAFSGGYLRGMYVQSQKDEAKQAKAENEAYEEIKPIELKAATDLSNIGGEYVKEKKQNEANINSAVAGVRIVRVKSNCASLPTDSSAGSRIDGAGSANGGAASEADFADLTRQVEKLGLDYDNAVTKISKLQDTVNVYQSVCGIAKP